MEARCDNLPAHLSPLDEAEHSGLYHIPITMCGVAPDHLSIQAYPAFGVLLRSINLEATPCNYAAQDRRTGWLLVRPIFLSLYHERIRPLAEAEINWLWALGRNNLLTIDAFMRFHNGEADKSVTSVSMQNKKLG